MDFLRFLFVFPLRCLSKCYITLYSAAANCVKGVVCDVDDGIDLVMTPFSGFLFGLLSGEK